ncbi:MAG TPA: NAD-dependent epimerase/dehydratase family protein [Flavitalea sp.]|nr:NAD-dependent epimerase/dehydratase family protein [Flavitalea sp.]
MKTILVTGATGFIGRYLVPLLVNNHTVIATSRQEDNARHFEWYKNTKYIPFDLATFDPQIDYYTFFGKPDLLIHLAWEGLPDYKSPFHTEINLPRHYLFLHNLITNGLKDITITGTCLEYGMQEGALSEEMEVKPANAYAIAKNQLREAVGKLSDEYRVILKWVRLFYMYGKGQHPKSLAAQLDKAIEENKKIFDMSGGEQVRDFLPVEKVAENIVKIALQQQETGIINCSSNQPVSVKKFVESYLAERDLHIILNTGVYSYPDYEPMQFWGKNERLKKIIG